MRSAGKRAGVGFSGLILTVMVVLGAGAAGCQGPAEERPPSPLAVSRSEASSEQPLAARNARTAAAPLPRPEVEAMPGGGLMLRSRIDHVQVIERGADGKYRRTCLPPRAETRTEMEQARHAGAARPSTVPR